MMPDATAPSRIKVIKEHKEKGGLVAAVFPIHYARPLFRAFDILPVEVWGPHEADTSHGDAHMQSYTCSVARRNLSYLIDGGLDIADLIIVPHCCDTLQGLSSILLDFIPQKRPVFPIYIPRGRRDEDIGFLTKELFALGEKLRGLTGIYPDGKCIIEAIETENQATKMTKSLFERRRLLPCTDREFYTLIRAREYLPAEQFTSAGKLMLAGGQTEPSSRIPILLSGVVPEPMDIFDVLYGLGAIVVADDFLSTGRRLYHAAIHDDPWHRMAESIVLGPPDSTRGDPLKERIQHLLDLVRGNGAQAVVFFHPKFCDPEQFYLPSLTKALEQSHIPSISVEVDMGGPLLKQLITRLEAFMEVLS